MDSEIKVIKNEHKNSIEKIESFLFKDYYIIKHFINALNGLVLVEMDIKEWVNKKERQNKIIPYYKKNDNIILKFGAEDFLYNKSFPLIKGIDAYGSAVYNINGNNVFLLNTYGEKYFLEKRYNNTNFAPLISVCFMYEDNIEVADIVLSKKIMPRKKFFVYNHMTGKIPKELIGIELGGYKAFHFYPTERIVSLKLLNKNFKIPQIHKHLDSEDWESEPYIKIHLEIV